MWIVYQIAVHALAATGAVLAVLEIRRVIQQRRRAQQWYKSLEPFGDPQWLSGESFVRDPIEKAEENQYR
jgi:hypothetical protein